MRDACYHPQDDRPRTQTTMIPPIIPILIFALGIYLFLRSVKKEENIQSSSSETEEHVIDDGHPINFAPTDSKITEWNGGAFGGIFGTINNSTLDPHSNTENALPSFDRHHDLL